MQQPIKYPIGLQDFRKIREGGYVYVDKTALIQQLVDTGSYYFLSRPRRFGKSLLLSTIKAYFSGERELFNGLAIAKRTEEWAQHPVLHLDLGGQNYADEASLNEVLNVRLNEWEKRYGKGDDETGIADGQDHCRLFLHCQVLPSFCINCRQRLRLCLRLLRAGGGQEEGEQHQREPG